ncbi:MAG: hypothetical protein K6G60_10530 [Lachnospiraceae bacterium]|nr:hypothetical protein [Lachnospiraceae bacterium]
MKSFFKKLSLVLVAAMVITLIPAQSAKAAPTPLAIGLNETDAKAGKGISIEVGETSAKLGFWGVTNYNVAGANTKKWSTSDKTIATVNDGKVTGVKAGTATISLTLTNNNIDYAGAVTVTVKAKASTTTTNGNVSVKQTAYNAIVVTFADEAAAKAAEKALAVERVKSSAKGTFYLNVNATKKVVKNTIEVTGLADQVTYRVTVPGVATPFTLTMSIGPAADLILEYPTVYVGTGVDITGSNVKNPTVTPIVKIVDANGYVTNDDVKKVKYTTDKTKNQYATFTAGTGKIKFSSINGQCYVKATYTFKDAAGTMQTLTDETTVNPVQYVAPNLQGFVEQICLTDKKGDKVVYPGNYEFTGSLAVGESKNIAYYFEATDGTKYTGKNVQTTVEYDGIKVANDTDYKFYFEKDDASATVLSLNEYGSYATVKGWNEGTERVCLYQRVGNTRDNKVDTLVGVIDITVQPEPYVFDMQLSDSSIAGYTNALLRKGELTYALIDQYNQPIKGEVLAKGADGSNLTANLIKIEPKDGKWDSGEGKIIVDFEILTATEKEVVLSVKGTEYSETLSLSAEAVKLDSSDLGYEIVVENKEVKNADFATTNNREDLGINFKVAETRDGVRVKYVSFAVSSEDVDKTTPFAQDKLVLVLSDLDDKIFTKDASTDIPATSNAFTTNSGTNRFAFATVTPEDGVTFDLYNNAAEVESIIGEQIFTGTVVANLWKTTGTTAAGQYDLQNTVEVEISNSMELIKDINNTFKLSADKDKVKTESGDANKVWKDAGEVVGTVTSTEHYTALVRTIIGELYGWFDKNSDTKATSDEVGAIKTLFPDYQVVDSKYVPGAYDNEVFIKTVTITYPLGIAFPGTEGTATAEQTITVNRKYVFKAQ